MHYKESDLYEFYGSFPNIKLYLSIMLLSICLKLVLYEFDI